jgi:MoxR-like ATPase
MAFLNGRGYVTPQDVKDVAHDVLRHRVILTYEAEAEQMTPEDVIATILTKVPVP